MGEIWFSSNILKDNSRKQGIIPDWIIHICYVFNFCLLDFVLHKNIKIWKCITLLRTFVYEPILLKISMNANIVTTQIFHKIKYDLKGHSRSQTMTYLFKNNFFFCLCYWLIEETNAAEHYERTKFDLCSSGQLFVLVLLWYLWWRVTRLEEL